MEAVVIIMVFQALLLMISSLLLLGLGGILLWTVVRLCRRIDAFSENTNSMAIFPPFQENEGNIANSSLMASAAKPLDPRGAALVDPEG